MEFETPELTSAGARLFVYGTLRRGFAAHDLLRRHHSRFLGNGYVQGRLYDLSEYPGAVWSASPTERVHGEVYLLPRACVAFKVLDRFEGYDPERSERNMFEREQTTVKLAGGREIQAWTYWLRKAYHSRRRLLTEIYRMCRV